MLLFVVCGIDETAIFFDNLSDSLQLEKKNIQITTNTNKSDFFINDPLSNILFTSASLTY
jgi:hypothetical protein